MSPLALFPLLVVATMAAPAPGGQLAAINPLVHGHGLAYAAGPALSYAHAPAVAYAHQQVQVQVPLTKTIHYESKPVVTGYQTTILKPSIATHAFATPVLAQPALVAAPAPAPVVVEAPAAVVQEEKPVEVAQPVVQEPAPVQQVVEQQEAAPVQADSADTEVIENPEFRSAAQPAAAEVRSAAPAQALGLNYIAAPGAYATYAAVPSAPAAVVYSAQAPHFDQLVTKEKVLAPVRTHTQITPQLTQVQPEVTVRRVIQEVPVAQPVAYTHTQYVQQPALTYAAAGPFINKVHHF